MRQQVAAAVVAQYQGQALSSTTPAAAVRRPRRLPRPADHGLRYNDQQSQMMADFAVQAKQLEMRQAAAKRELDADRRDQEEARQGEGRDRRQGRRGQGRCSARSRTGPPSARSRSRTAPRRPRPPGPGDRNVAASGRAAPPCSYAHGPGRRRLRLRRRRPERVRLLRPDDDGLGAGRRQPAALLERADGLRHRRSPQSQLQPGDLVFYYSPVSHVGMYIGNGQIVHAANPSVGVTDHRCELDAVLRCRPTRLTRRSQGRPPTLVGGRPCAVPARRRRRSCVVVLVAPAAARRAARPTAPAPAPADAPDDGRPPRRRRRARCSSAWRRGWSTAAARDVVALAAPGDRRGPA